MEKHINKLYRKFEYELFKEVFQDNSLLKIVGLKEMLDDN